MVDVTASASMPPGARSSAHHNFGSLPSAAQFAVTIVCVFGLLGVAFGLSRLNLAQAPVLLALLALAADHLLGAD